MIVVDRRCCSRRNRRCYRCCRRRCRCWCGVDGGGGVGDVFIFVVFLNGGLILQFGLFVLFVCSFGVFDVIDFVRSLIGQGVRLLVRTFIDSFICLFVCLDRLFFCFATLLCACLLVCSLSYLLSYFCLCLCLVCQSVSVP